MSDDRPLSPLTGRADVSLVATLDPIELIREWQRVYQIDITDEFSGIEKIRQYRCNRSGLVFFDPPEAAGSAELYAKLRTFDWYYPVQKWEFDRALSLVAKGQEILELGCGFGHFLKAAQECGRSVTGVEISPPACEACRREGLEVIQLPKEVERLESGREFDAVVSFQVLEHINDVGGFLRYYLQFLKPGGKLLVAVPNCDGYLKRRFELLNLPPHHMSHWDRRSLKGLGESFGLEVLEIRAEPLPNSLVDYYLDTYIRYLQQEISIWRYILNRRSQGFWRGVFGLGVRRWFPGHTIMAVYRKH